MSDITFQVDDPSTPDVVALLTQLDAFLVDLYPGEDNHIMSVEALCQPHVTFLTARHGVRPIGCGAIVNQNGAYAEVKRMFVVPEFRGQKIARHILAELEVLAKNSGLTLMRLETGALQVQAIRLYESAGYKRCGRFGTYPNIPLSVFFEKPVPTFQHSSVKET